MSDFYNQLAPIYHLIHQDWGASIVRHGEQLSALIEAEWPGSIRVLDVSCGICTQAIGLASRGYSVTASDLSERAIERARREAALRGLDVPFAVCDMRRAFEHHGSGYDVVISADNSVPHLLSDDEILIAFEQMHACLRPSGGVLITVRDYQNEQRGRNIVKPYGVRVEDNKRYVLFQVWDFEGEHYNLAFFFVEEDVTTGHVQTHVMRSKYYAISTERLCELQGDAGFIGVRRIDGAFFQPVIVGTKVTYPLAFHGTFVGTVEVEGPIRGRFTSGQCFKQGPGLDHIRRVKPLSEPAVDLGKHVPGFLRFTLAVQRTAQARRGAQLQRLRLLAAGDRNGFAETSLRLVFSRASQEE